MLSRLFFVVNFFILAIVFTLKTYYETSFEWFYSLPWLTFFNGFIDIAIKTEVESSYILTFWFILTIIWLIFLIKEGYFEKIHHKDKIASGQDKPLNIDELNDVKSNDPSFSNDENNKKIDQNPENIGANFAAALSQAVSKNSDINETPSSSSGFFDQANQALSSMTPDAAKKLRKVQSVLNKLEATDKRDDLRELTKKNL
jgi:hypothetical protein